jgi:GNAT superfamily N-acetyltransferase
MTLRIEPVTAERWPDVELLFGPNGTHGGCWCMYLRETAQEFAANAGAGNRARFAAIVRAGDEPGLLAYDGDEPVAWVAVAPRSGYPRILRSPLHKPIDDETDVWAVTCFFIARPQRGAGVAHTLLEGAVRRARRNGARIVEGYPFDPGDDLPDAAEMWRGSIPMFERAGFEVVARRKPLRPIMRLRLPTARRSGQ